MTLNQALTLIRRQPLTNSRRKLFLVCGFQPLHLATFIKGEIAERFPAQTAELQTGLYGDLEGSLRAAAQSNAEAAVIAIEWSDLDSRLGLRGSGGWGPSIEQDIIASSRERWGRILAGITSLAGKMPVALTTPSLPVPLFGHTAGWHISEAEAELQRQAAGFLAEVVRVDRVSAVHPSRLAQLSPEGLRGDAKMELIAGFPYSLGHASTLASLLVKLLFPPPPMKGLITDLDNTLWSGIVGEVGVSGVSWCLADHTQIHGLYQQQLRQLGEMGVLLGIVSKNEPALVEEALRRPDLYVSKDAFYPVRCGWKPKSQAVAEILSTWKIGQESVVFIDDSPMEVDEVRTAFPGMTGILFPSRNPGKAVELFGQLRDHFGKAVLQREDQLRQASIRGNAQFQEAANQSSGNDFIRGLQGKVMFDCRKDSQNKRLLELINKTNQFNLNGVRITEGEWLQQTEEENRLVVGVSYEDKFGPLGTIGVIAGRQSEDQVDITSWVLSCRAFSRKIEYHILDYLFRQTGATTLRFDFRATERNQPLQEFLRSLDLNCDNPEGMEISLDQFRGRHDDLPHETAK